MSVTKCPWVDSSDPLYVKYHDEEWGIPLYDENKIFEFLVLEIFQAGLSWRIVLNKRESFRKAFVGFDPGKVAKFSDANVEQLLKDTGIIRNKAKILATINNAQRFLEVQKEFGSFSKYMWNWVGNAPILHDISVLTDYPKYTEEAVLWAKDLKRRGFKFLGPTVLYAHMQATGMVNDHSVDCFCRNKIRKFKFK